MSEQQIEDLKRICLICGCHTNQAIDIHEPRNGPNIVELIQAKFKFQPINEDKYLCFSCNNWLINWHSLKNINRETGANHSGKSRTRINDAIPEEETDNCSEPPSNCQNHHHHHHNQQLYQSNNPNKRRNGFYFSERSSLSSHRIRKLRRKFRTCSSCGRSVRKRTCRFAPMQKSIQTKVRCKRCSSNRKWQPNQLDSLKTRWRHETNKIPLLIAQQYFENLVNYSRIRPMVDGKIIAMLRRVGTTVTSESDRIALVRMSEKTAIKKPETRKLDENEILIDFNRVLSEALPLPDTKVDFETTPKPEEEETDHSIEAIYFKIPKCVSVSLVNTQNHSI